MVQEMLHYQRLVSQLNQEVNDLKAKLSLRTHQLSILQHVAQVLAATPKVNQIASVLTDFFVQEFGARSCVVWTLEHGGDAFHPRAGFGLPRSAWNSLALPAPNPFPRAPMVLFQDQWLDQALTPPELSILRNHPDNQLFFIPFEHQLLLMGFAVLCLEKGRRMEDEEETLNVLQRQVAVSVYNAWLFRDLGEQRDALREKTAELERANAALTEADRFKSEFLALTSHELRTPLTGILGFTRLVLDGLYEDEEEMEKMLRDSYASGQHLLQLLNDILDLAKIESGRMQIHTEPWSIQTLVQEVRIIANAYPRKPEVQLLWPEGLDQVPDILVDPGRLKQVLLNILSNALKFTKVGYVALVVERSFGHIDIRVQDTGIGIPLEAQPRLFQKFVQADGGHAREYGGTGLGLVICKHLMEMMGGTISLYSEGADKGTTITLTVPIA